MTGARSSGGFPAGATRARCRFASARDVRRAGAGAGAAVALVAAGAGAAVVAGGTRCGGAGAGSSRLGAGGAVSVGGSVCSAIRSHGVSWPAHGSTAGVAAQSSASSASSQRERLGGDAGTAAEPDQRTGAGAVGSAGV